MTTYFKDLDGSVLQRKTHMDHSQIYEGKIQTYSDLLNLLRHVITISGDDYPVTSKMLIPMLTSLKKVCINEVLCRCQHQRCALIKMTTMAVMVIIMTMGMFLVVFSE